MILEQFVLESLGHASYLIASERTGEALVLDPRRDVDVYLAAERRHGVRIVAVVDSHQHNDYVSGILELAERTGATVYASAAGEVAYDHVPLKDGERLEYGEMIVEVLHTPGHTPEHLSLLVFDAKDEPAILLSGGALLVGDLARPDLLGDQEAKREAARTFCRTLQDKILPLPDHLLVYPTHVAGSLCGGSIGSRLATTVGYERATNPVLAAVSARDVFVEECLRMDDLPGVPPYWRRMRGMNVDGAPPMGVLPEPQALRASEFADRIEAGAVVLDTRAPEAFAGAHVPGALNAGLGSSFPTWAGTVVPPGREVVLVLDRSEDLWEATWGLLRTGYEPPVGWLAGGMQSWRTSSRPIAALAQMPPKQLAEAKDDVFVLDVRQPAEWNAAHIEGATWITGADVPERIDEIPTGRPVVVVCGSGYRSSVVASLLLARGHREVWSLLGGMSAWKANGLPTTKS